MIRKYQHPEDFRYFTEWVTDATLLALFSGPEWKFPLTEEQIENHRSKNPFKQLYLGCDDSGKPYAIGELIWNEPDSPRLGRLLIGEADQRSKGLGKIFIRELIEEFKRFLDPPCVSLFVLEDNVRAVRCYEHLGFQSDDLPRKLTIDGKERMMLKMNLELKK